jgi:hypothetical protein
MNLLDIARKVEKMAVDNSPSLLTGIGVVGTVATAYLTGKAAVKASQLIRIEEAKKTTSVLSYRLNNKEKIELVWVEFIPPVASCAVTIGAIIGANHIGSRRAAAVAAAYSLSEKAYAEYKEKVVEKLGEKKEEKIRDEIAQDRVNKNPSGSREVIITGNGDVMCYDSLTGRYFKSSVEAIRRAENEINKQILDTDYATLSDFFDKLGLRATAFSNEMGWNTDRMLEVRFSTVISDDNQPCISIEYDELPIRDYFRMH